MADDWIANIRRCRREIWFIQCAAQKRARRQRMSCALCSFAHLRTALKPPKYERNRRMCATSRFAGQAERARNARTGTQNLRTSVRSTLPEPTHSSRRENSSRSVDASYSYHCNYFNRQDLRVLTKKIEGRKHKLLNPQTLAFQKSFAIILELCGNLEAHANLTQRLPQDCAGQFR